MSAYLQLGALAASLGIPHAGEAAFAFERGGVHVVVSLEIDSGVVRGVLL